MRRILFVSVISPIAFAAACVSSSATTPDAGTFPDSGAPDTSTPLKDGGSLEDVATPTDAAEASSACPIPVTATTPATLRFTADNQRAVYLNGAVVEDNPGIGWGTVSTFVVTLNRNPTVPNVIAILGTNTSSQGGADRGVIADLSLDADGGAPDPDAGAGTLLVTDGTWRFAPAGADAGTDWTAVKFDDSTWSAAIDQGPNGMSPWGAILGSSPARWIWSYDSAAAATKPDFEAVSFRRTFYLSTDGRFLDAPGTCP